MRVRRPKPYVCVDCDYAEAPIVTPREVRP
jgi:hypothetical protein